MLERLAGNKFFCFLDGFSGYFQIPIEPVDQEKTTFTCPYRTYAYKHMPFGLCNAPATFQRCIIAIFQDMLETFIEVFMDDFLVFEDSFDFYLVNLEQMLVRCKQAHLVLNWEKWHAGFYRRFIKDFSKISRPMTKLLEKDAVFDFNEECIEAFELLKEKLTNAPIMVSPDWSLPFELKCDVIDFAVGAVLEQWEGKHFRPFHFASKSFEQFDFEIQNKKGAENVATDNLSRLENPHLEELRNDYIIDNFLDETLMNVSSTEEDNIPWLADFANYLVGKILRKGLTYA
ncbi:reverse transcriptase domain-containing protein [Tanacetum coccineum]